MKNKNNQLHRKSKKKNNKLKRKKNNWKVAFPLLIFFILAIIFLSFLISPLSKIKNVSIKGSVEVKLHNIKQETGFKVGDSIFKILKDRSMAAKKIINRNHLVKKVDFNFSNINNLTIEIEEYRPLAYVFKNGEYYLVLSNGDIYYKPYPYQKYHRPILVGFSSSLQRKNLIFQYKKFPKDIKKDVKEIKFIPIKKEDEERVKLKMDDGNIVIAKISTLGDKMGYYPSIIGNLNKKSVINLEVGAYSYPQSK